MSDPETTAPVAPATPKKKRSKLLVIGIPLAMLLAGSGAGGWWYTQRLKAAPAADEKPKAAETEPSGLLAFEPFTVNLADPGGRRYLRIALHLVLPDADAAKHLSEDELAMARIRSVLIDVLATRLASDLGTPEGRAELKKLIAEAASHAGHLEVKDVLLQEFVVQ